ncbi:MAG: hypothetical protein JRI36_07260 [Deltaproteobacteria bacterium]|nr:hypothetical protein [Deltaproteobacteria bacterium]
MNFADAPMEALDRIYACYDALAKDFTTACTRGCSLCCTQDVTLTSLEGRYLLRHILKNGREDLLLSFHDNPALETAGRVVTTNEFAQLCFSGKDLSEDGIPSARQPCKLLSHGQCAVYEARPFGCRCFFSTRPCEKEACAVVDPFLLTLNTVFLQFIEHIDRGGFFGKLEHVVVALERRIPYTAAGGGTWPPALPTNCSIPGLLIPPEHRSRMEPIVSNLVQIASGIIRTGHANPKRSN